jgi:tetratricopeptide (TPR) repeat protein
VIEDPTQPKERIGVAYENRAVILHSQKEYSRALADYDKAIELNPRSATAHFNRGFLLHFGFSDREGAYKSFTQAIQLDPNDAFAYNARGHVLLDQNKIDRAIADYDVAINLEPELAKLSRIAATPLTKRANGTKRWQITPKP